MTDRLEIVPCSIADAVEFVRQHHRHARAPQGALWALAVALGSKVVGVATVGRPVARALDDGWTCEVTRLATDGTKNACSKLYRAAWRAARVFGYRKVVTYTLASESGTSLRAAGFRVVGEVKAESWSRPSRPRVDRAPKQAKLRWEAACA